MELKFDEKGLIPAIVQDHYTKEVLTLAYMNAETLALTIAEGRTVFWSRSRQEIWRKGETSGNVQRVVSITADCDADALVVEVVKDGPACHTGAESCFFNEVYVSPELKQFSWQGLYELIKGRKTDPKEGSYTTYLFEKGKEKILKKVGEECTEVIIAGEKEDKEETVYEISDLAYHVLVLMVSAGITVEEGVYAGMLGPTFETPAEVAMLKGLGVSYVGMSTVCEVIMAHALGMNVLGLTLAANESGDSSVTHQSVLEEAERHAADFESLVRGVLRLL